MANATTYNVELRDKNGNLRQYITPWVKNPSWEWRHRGGCGSCNMLLKMPYRKITFNAKDDIQIRIKDGSASKLVYRGWIGGTIPALKTDQQITLKTKGYAELLDKLIVQDSGDKKEYTNALVSDIVDDIIDTYVVPKTNITKGIIDASSFTADKLTFKTSVNEALRTCADLLGNVEYGVDENLTFFWRTVSTNLRRMFFVGDNCKVLERRVNWDKLLNKIYFEGGLVGGSPYLRTAEQTGSQSDYFLSEGIVNNSAITTSSVADQYLTAILQKRAIPQYTLRIRIPNTKLRLEDTIPMGKISVYDVEHDENVKKYLWGKAANGGSSLIWGRVSAGGSGGIWGGGGVYQDQVDRIIYRLSESPEKFNIDIQMGGTVMEASAKIKQLELLLSTLRQR